MSFGRVILGDNQFLGVNHSNQAKAVQLYEQFSKPDAIIEVIGAAYEAGVRDFMFTTHDRFEPVFEEVRRSNLFPGMHYSPCLPYAHKYWSKLSAQSLPSVLKETLFQVNALQVVPAGFGLLKGNLGGFMKILAEIELLMCKGLPLRGVFLQNAAFDLLMSIDAKREIEAFAKAVKNTFGVEPGFITMNHVQAVDMLCNKIQLEQPWLCSNFNMAGFRMNPSPEAVIDSFASRRTRNIAMSIFSSGAARAEDSLKYVLGRHPEGGVDAILFGSSSPHNIATNSAAILNHMA